MNLTRYIARQKGNGQNLAAALGIPASYLSQMASGYRPVSPERAAEIERKTGGLVTRRELRPHDWRLIWPELVKRSGR